jgi:RNA polymerase sigma-70 factor (ECF subfamily)
MSTPLSVRRSDFRRTELSEAVVKERPEGPDRLSGQQQASDLIVQNKDDRAMFDEVFQPHMAEAYRLARWLTGNSYDAEDVVRMPHCARFAASRVSVPSMLELGP